MNFGQTYLSENNDGGSLNATEMLLVAEKFKVILNN